MDCLEQLIEISSPGIVDAAPMLDAMCASALGDEASALRSLLARKNGFVAFESALHVYPAQPAYAGVELGRWNSADLWRAGFGGPADKGIFFASDIFGGQFCVFDNAVYQFDPETAEQKWLASSIENWADVVLGDYAYLTGYPLAHEWQVAYGPLPPEMRLIPKRPFVLGGEFEISNLRMVNALEAMTSRSGLARRIKDMPDGGSVTLELTPAGPTRADVEQKLLDLIVGRCSREQASSWASQFVAGEAEVKNEGLWNAIVALSGADLPSTDRRYLHDETDFRVWLEQLRQSR